MTSVIFLSLHDLGVYFIFGAFVAGTGLLLAEVAWRWENRQRVFGFGDCEYPHPAHDDSCRKWHRGEVGRFIN